MLPLFHLHVATLENRYEILPKIHDSVCAAGAWVTNYQRFSSASVCLDLEVAVQSLSSVHLALKSLGLNVDPEYDTFLDPFRADISMHPEKFIPGTLVIKLLREDDLPGAHMK
jgi:hypothetical protein